MGDKGKTIIGIVFVIALFVGAIIIAGNIQNNEAVQELISSFGIFGILLVSFIGGLNLLVPVPATAFIPIFTAAGFSSIIIISTIVFGTTVADLVAYYFGTILKNQVGETKNRFYRFLKKWCEGKPATTQAIVFLYASIAPVPNEVLLIPLGMLGVKLRSIILAFVIGNIIHVTVLAYGLNRIVEVF